MWNLNVFAILYQWSLKMHHVRRQRLQLSEWKQRARIEVLEQEQEEKEEQQQEEQQQ